MHGQTSQNHRADWTRQEVKDLRQLAKQNTPTRVIGLKLARMPASIQNKATRNSARFCLTSLKSTIPTTFGRISDAVFRKDPPYLV
jgi:hypothetical protein